MINENVYYDTKYDVLSVYLGKADKVYVKEKYDGIFFNINESNNKLVSIEILDFNSRDKQFLNETIKVGIDFEKVKTDYKKLLISLDDTEEFTHISYNDTQRAVNNGADLIITPNMQFFDQYHMKDYMIYATDGENTICLNKLIASKEVRQAQNASKMLLSGCFKLNVENYWLDNS